MNKTMGTWVSVAALAMAAGCGTETGGETTSSTNTGGSGGQGGASTPALEVTVITPPPAMQPLEGATCAVEIAGRDVIEATTDANGKALFDVVDWTTPASVTCAQVNVTSQLGVTPESVPDGKLEIWIQQPPAAPAETVIASGNLLNPAGSGSTFFVEATNGTRNYQHSLVHYAFPVAKGEPFDLLALEFTYHPPAPNTFNQQFLGWTVQSQVALDASTVIDIDLGSTVQPNVANGSVGRPTASDSPFVGPQPAGLLYVFPKERYGNTFVGFATDTSFTTDGRLLYTAESIDMLYPPEDVVTVFVLFQSFTALRAESGVLVEGYPPSGDLAETFLDAPLTLEPNSMVPLEGAVVRWDPAGELPTTLYVVDDAGHNYYVNFPEDVSEIVVPKLPSNGVGLATGVLHGALSRFEMGDIEGFNSRYVLGTNLEFSR